MKQENKVTSRVEKYSELRKEIVGSEEKVSSKPRKTEKVTTRPRKTSTETVTIPINNNVAMETNTIDLKPAAKDENKNPQIYDSYKKRKTFKMVLYFVGIAVVISLIIFLLVLIIR